MLWKTQTLIIFLSDFFFLLDALINLVGQQNARNGIIKIFNALQEASANKHLIYVRENRSNMGVLKGLRPPV